MNFALLEIFEILTKWGPAALSGVLASEIFHLKKSKKLKLLIYEEHLFTMLARIEDRKWCGPREMDALIRFNKLYLKNGGEDIFAHRIEECEDMHYEKEK